MSLCVRSRMEVASTAASLLAVLAVASPAPSAPPVQAETGTIKGRLVWGGAEAPKPAILKADKDAEVCAKGEHVDRKLVVDPKTKGIANAFVYVATPKGKNPEAEKKLLAAHPKVEIDQKACEFYPYSTAAHKGQAFVFKSSDEVGHNVHYTGFNPANNKNFALQPRGVAEEKLQAEARPINLKCDIHPWMSGTIMVFDHPFFAVTKEDGSFEIEGVPVGAQAVVVRLADGKYVTEGAAKGKAVAVKAGDNDLGAITLDPAKAAAK